MWYFWSVIPLVIPSVIPPAIPSVPRFRSVVLSDLGWLWMVLGSSGVALCGGECVRSGFERVEWFRVGFR